MSSTLIKNNFIKLPNRTLEQGTGSVSLPNHEKKPKVVGTSPPLSMLDKLERIHERHLSDPPDTSDLKPYQISMEGKDHCMTNQANSVSSVLRSNRSKRSSSNSSHLPLAEFMSF